MQINLTLVVQVVHFLAAYWFLRRYLFTPVVHLLEQEDAEQRRLQEAVQAHERSVAQADELRRSEWRECHETLVEHKPTVATTAPEVPSIPALQHVELSQEKQRALVGELGQQIAQKVSL